MKKASDLKGFFILIFHYIYRFMLSCSVCSRHVYFYLRLAYEILCFAVFTEISAILGSKKLPKFAGENICKEDSVFLNLTSFFSLQRKIMKLFQTNVAISLDPYKISFCCGCCQTAQFFQYGQF